MAWQSIDSARRDGTEIVACVAPSKGGGAFAIFTCAWRAEPPRRPQAAWRMTGGFAPGTQVNPTHWDPDIKAPADA